MVVDFQGMRTTSPQASQLSIGLHHTGANCVFFLEGGQERLGSDELGPWLCMLFIFDDFTTQSYRDYFIHQYVKIP